MTESIVESKLRPRNRVWIKLSGGRFFTIPESEASAFPAGAELSGEDINRLSRIDQFHRGKEKLLRLLSIRPRTRKEMEEALDKMEINSGVIEGILAEMVECGFVNDRKFAVDYARAKSELKGLGPHRIGYELKRLGVNGTIIKSVLEEKFDSSLQREMAWAAAKKKLGSARLNQNLIKRVSNS